MQPPRSMSTEEQRRITLQQAMTQYGRLFTREETVTILCTVRRLQGAQHDGCGPFDKPQVRRHQTEGWKSAMRTASDVLLDEAAKRTNLRDRWAIHAIPQYMLYALEDLEEAYKAKMTPR